MGIVVPLPRPEPPPSPDSAGEPTDADLVRRAREGDERAMERLYRRHARMVVGLAHRLIGHRGEVDDVVQETFLTAFESLGKLRDPQAFGGWLGGITVRKARRRLSRRRVEALDVERLVSRGAPPDVGTELRNLYGLLHQLPPDVRIALVLRRVEGMTLPAIAQAMGKSLATVKRRLDDGEVLLTAQTRTP